MIIHLISHSHTKKSYINDPVTRVGGPQTLYGGRLSAGKADDLFHDGSYGRLTIFLKIF